MPIFMTKLSKSQNLSTYSLDSAGIIYPYVAQKNWNNVFRIEAELDAPINIDNLNIALSKMHTRFPYFFSQIIKDKKSYMLYECQTYDVAQEENKICRSFNLEEYGKPVIRVTYNRNRLGLEVFHSITDGHGALVFFENLIAQYLKASGVQITYDETIRDCSKSPEIGEKTDAFRLVSKEGRKKISRINTGAWQYAPFKKRSELTVTDIEMPSDVLHFVAKSYGTTVTAFLTAVYIYSFLNCGMSPHRKISISVPIDMRKILKYDTLRNFSLYVLISIGTHGKKSLEDIINAVSRQFKDEIDKDKLTDMAYYNAADSNSSLFKNLPFPLKKVALKFGYNFLGENYFTSSLSSFGNIYLPHEISNHVTSLKVILGEQRVNRIAATASSYLDVTHIMLSSRVCDDSVQRCLAETLKSCSIPVKITKRTSLGTQNIIFPTFDSDYNDSSTVFQKGAN